MLIKYIYYIKTILDRATAGSYNGQSGYYSVSDNMFSEGHSCYCDNGDDWYSDLKGIFNCATTDFSCTGFSPSDLESGNYHMTIVKLAGVDHLTLLFGGITINLNFDGNYYYTQNYYSSYGGTLYRFDYVNGEITYVKTYGNGASYATVDENVETTLFSSASIMMYYSGADRNINYATIGSEQGIGPGGWQVPNPNPTRKIVINGSEPDDIKLNGVTPDKIMLNGQCYYEKPYVSPYLYEWDFTESLIDKAQNVEANLFGSNASNITRDSEGIHITQSEQKIGLDNIDMRGKTLEIDIPYFNFSGPNNGWMTCIVLHSSQDHFICPFQLEQTKQLNIYGWSLNSYTKNGYSVTFNRNDINNKTIKLIYGSEKGIKIYVDDVLLFDNNTYYYDTDYHDTSYLSLLGGLKNDSAIACYNMTISGVRIYENEE